jgi:hypothetical protein
MRLLAATACCLLFACADEEPPDPPACDDAVVPGEVIDGALELGTGGPPDFVPAADGSSLELARGSQGGWMITPTLAAGKAALGGDGACVHLSIDVDLGTVEPPPHFEGTASDMAEDGGRWYTEPLLVLLSYDLAAVEGRTATITAMFEDDGVAASRQVAVRLENRE